MLHVRRQHMIFKSENRIENIKRVSAQIPHLLVASFLGCTMSNKATLLGESLENLFLVNLPTEIPENPPSDTSKKRLFRPLSKLQKFESHISVQTTPWVYLNIHTTPVHCIWTGCSEAVL
jgi:hypothetical protein